LQISPKQQAPQGEAPSQAPSPKYVPPLVRQSALVAWEHTPPMQHFPISFVHEIISHSEPIP